MSRAHRVLVWAAGCLGAACGAVEPEPPAGLGEQPAGGVVTRGRVGVGSSSLHSALAPTVSLGLGSAEVMDRLTVAAPGRAPWTLSDLPVRRRLRLVE